MFAAAFLATNADSAARLVVLSWTKGGVSLDAISLFPRKIFKDRANGLRADLAQAVADLKSKLMRFPGGGASAHCPPVTQVSQPAVSQRFQPASHGTVQSARVLRSPSRLETGDTADLEVCATGGSVKMRPPGGCLVHGHGLGNKYRWQDSIGPVEQRRGQPNLWGYHQSLGLGYFEFFQSCEDIGAKPLPVVPAGVCCQNADHHAHRAGGLLNFHHRQAAGAIRPYAAMNQTFCMIFAQPTGGFADATGET